MNDSIFREPFESNVGSIPTPASSSWKSTCYSTLWLPGYGEKIAGHVSVMCFRDYDGKERGRHRCLNDRFGYCTGRRASNQGGPACSGGLSAMVPRLRRYLAQSSGLDRRPRRYRRRILHIQRSLRRVLSRSQVLHRTYPGQGAPDRKIARGRSSRRIGCASRDSPQKRVDC